MDKFDRQSMDVDIVCVGFGPAVGGFLTTLSQELLDEAGNPKLESLVMPGMPLQIVCYERADDISFGVSGVVSRARSIKKSFPGINISEIPMATEVKNEKTFYLLDPFKASKRSFWVKLVDGLLRIFSFLPFYKNYSVKMPFNPPFMNKHDGYIFSIGQFNSWVGSKLMDTGLVQIWPGTPAEKPLIEKNEVVGIRLLDQGVDKNGNPGVNFMPGMDIKAKLTVVGDGPVGSVGNMLDEYFGLPKGCEKNDWAVGAKMLVELRNDSGLKSGEVIHTLGYPEPEIFGFLYVHPENLASVGIFVPSWFDNPVKASYKYLQYWITHPALWNYLEGGTLKSWGAKSIQESGKRGEPFWVGDGYARIGEGSGSTNLLSNSGVDEAWMSGVILARGVIEILKNKKTFSKEHLENTYVRLRKESWLEKEALVAKKARDGFQKGFFPGIIGTVLTWLTRGKVSYPAKPLAVYKRVKGLEEYYKSRLNPDHLKKIKEKNYSKGVTLNEEIMKNIGWPEIKYDAKLLVSHQDALLLGGKVQAQSGFMDHVTFADKQLCKACKNKVCMEICSGQAITPGSDGVPEFDREKCVHCGACLWNCTVLLEKNKFNLNFSAGVGGLHSAEN